MGPESRVNKCCKRQTEGKSDTYSRSHKDGKGTGLGSPRNVWNFETGRGEKYTPPTARVLEEQALQIS